MDEDGMSSGDRGGMAELIKIIKQVKCQLFVFAMIVKVKSTFVGKSYT